MQRIHRTMEVKCLQITEPHRLLPTIVYRSIVQATFTSWFVALLPALVCYVSHFRSLTFRKLYIFALSWSYINSALVDFYKKNYTSLKSIWKAILLLLYFIQIIYRQTIRITKIPTATNNEPIRQFSVGLFAMIRNLFGPKSPVCIKKMTLDLALDSNKIKCSRSLNMAKLLIDYNTIIDYRSVLSSVAARSTE